MGASSFIRIVGDERIAGANISVPIQHRLDCRVERAEKCDHAVTLGDKFTIGIGNTYGVVERLINNRAHARTLQSHEHILTDSGESIADDLPREEVSW